MSSSFRLGIDVGGTFTDAVIISETTGESWIAKVPSTPRDPSIGFLNAVDAVLRAQTYANGNVSPQIIAAKLIRELATTLK